MQVATGLSLTLVAISENKIRRREQLTGFQGVIRCIGIYTRTHPQLIPLIYFKRELKIARPGQGAGNQFATGFGGWVVEGKKKGGCLVKVSPGAQFALDVFYPIG